MKNSKMNGMNNNKKIKEDINKQLKKKDSIIEHALKNTNAKTLKLVMKATKDITFAMGAHMIHIEFLAIPLANTKQ